MSTGMTHIQRRFGERGFEWELRKITAQAANLRKMMADFELQVGDTQIFTAEHYQGVEGVEKAALEKYEEYGRLQLAYEKQNAANTSAN